MTRAVSSETFKIARSEFHKRARNWTKRYRCSEGNEGLLAILSLTLRTAHIYDLENVECVHVFRKGNDSIPVTFGKVCQRSRVRLRCHLAEISESTGLRMDACKL